MLIIAISTDAPQMEPSALVAEVRERGLLEDAADLCAELEPDVAQPLGRAVVDKLVRPHASYGGDWPLELADDLGDRDLLWRTRELIAAFSAALARNRGGFLNFIYRPRSNLLLSMEFQRLETRSLYNDSTANHVDLSMGILF